MCWHCCWFNVIILFPIKKIDRYSNRYQVLPIISKSGLKRIYWTCYSSHVSTHISHLGTTFPTYISHPELLVFYARLENLWLGLDSLKAKKLTRIQSMWRLRRVVFFLIFFEKYLKINPLLKKNINIHLFTCIHDNQFKLINLYMHENYYN